MQGARSNPGRIDTKYFYNESIRIFLLKVGTSLGRIAKSPCSRNPEF